MILKSHAATFLKNYADYSNGKKNKQKKQKQKKVKRNPEWNQNWVNHNTEKISHV